MTKENLEKRLDALRKQREQLIGSINVLTGAIQILEDLLKEEAESAQPTELKE